MTMTYVLAGITALLAYLIGSINSSVILSKIFYKKDIREEGSGNAGTTNMLRSHGKVPAVITLLFDILKGVIAVFLANLISRSVQNETNVFLQTYFIPSFKYIAGIFVVIGHCFPVFFSFKGGKGVATSLGVILAINWKIALIVLVLTLLIMLLSGYVSVGSILSGLIFIVTDLSYMIFSPSATFFLPELLFGIILTLLIIGRHKTNIERLKNGTENKIFRKKKNEEKE